MNEIGTPRNKAITSLLKLQNYGITDDEILNVCEFLNMARFEGNVLSHHVKLEHDILDKYETGKGVINKDIVDFKSEKRYDLIISISTLEHVGWDEKPRDDTKIPRAIDNMRTLISSGGGTIMITVPLGYNPTLDKLLKDGSIQFSKQYHLIRISKGNEWREASWEDALAAKYNSPMPFANGLLIGIIEIEPSV